jgi:hypothetical protein
MKLKELFMNSIQLRPTCRVFGIHAQKVPLCILLRRGPRQWVQVILWNTQKDIFKEGAWFRGRIYERRCDLSPKGDYFIYFASKFTPRTLQKENTYSQAWTAVSEPPSLTAFLLWPKGNTWHGGGIFLDEKTLWLNHPSDQAIPHPSHQSTIFKVLSNPEAQGEDVPIYEKRLFLKGWRQLSTSPDLAAVWEKTLPDKSILRRSLKTIKSKSLQNRVQEEFYLLSPQGSVFPLSGTTWADLDLKGKILFSREGCVYRAYLFKNKLIEDKIIDLNPHTPPQEKREK